MDILGKMKDITIVASSRNNIKCTEKCKNELDKKVIKIYSRIQRYMGTGSYTYSANFIWEEIFMKCAKTVVAMLLSLVMVLSMTSIALAEDTIKIGSIGPLTGPYAAYGNGVANAIQLAIDEINAQGGLQYELLSEDDQGDGPLAVNAYNTEMDKGMQILVGTVTTGACAEVAAIAYEERVFMLTPSASGTSVTEGRDNVYQVCFIDPNQGAASAEYISEHNLGANIAVIYNNSQDYSTGIYQSFMAKAEELGLNVVSTTTFSDDANADFSVQLSDAKNNGADLVFIPIYYTPAAAILQQAAGMGYAPTFFGVDGMDGLLSIDGFDTALAEGVYMLTPFDANATDEMTVNFVTKYVELYGDTPNQFAADAYDAMYIIAQACEELGITADTSYEEACEMLIPWMQQATYSGLTGQNMTWDENGQVSKEVTAVVIRDGQYASVNG